jgi:hypothetical protein
MNTLRIVREVESPRFLDLMASISAILEGHIDTTFSVYGTHKLLMFTVRNTETDSQMRIIFDPANQYPNAQGIHTTLECDEYELCDKMERGWDDGFSTMWVRL